MAGTIGNVNAASAIFGSASGQSFFAIGVSSGATPAELAAKTTIEAAETEIKRIRGYKPRLTNAESKRLSEIQADIQAIEQKARDGTVRQDELVDRSELYLEADTIIGKPSAGVEADSTLEGYRQQIDDLLAPKLDRPRANRLETLEKLKSTIETQLDDTPDNRTAQLRLQNVNRQINELTPPRTINELSQSERVEYDNLVEQVNSYAQAKLVLNAQESIRVLNLEQTIQQMSSALPADQSGQPTAASVARAYARIG